MGRLLMRALEREGLSDVAERALSGVGLPDAELERLQKADILLVSGLADAVRNKHRGDEVCVYGSAGAAREAGCVLLDLGLEPEGATGAEVLLEIARARLRLPADRSLAVSVESLGLELAQSALVFGANALACDFNGKRTLPLLDGPQARRKELQGLIERAGFRVRFVEGNSHSMEQRS